MLDAYFNAFEGFLATGDYDRLAKFIDAGTDPAFLNVYRNGYFKTCTDALAASYPVVKALVGEDYFRRLARAYVEACPPTTGTLVGYGRDFAEFLQSQSHAHGLAYLPDAAAIEAAWLTSYFARDVVAMTPADVESLHSEGADIAAVRVRLTPSAQLVGLHHDIVDTWALIREHGALTRKVSLREEENTALLWRLDGKIHVRTLGPGEAAFLSTVAGVATLEAAGSRASDVDDSFDLASTFAALLQIRILQLESHKE